MKHPFRPLAVAAVLATSALYFSAAGAATPDPKGWNGTPVAGGRSDLVVDVTPSTRVVNVNEHQIVKFVVHNGGRDDEFMWEFNGARSVIPLTAIAPDGVAAPAVSIYVAPDPLDGGQSE